MGRGTDGAPHVEGGGCWYVEGAPGGLQDGEGGGIVDPKGGTPHDAGWGGREGGGLAVVEVDVDDTRDRGGGG